MISKIMFGYKVFLLTRRELSSLPLNNSEGKLSRAKWTPHDSEAQINCLILP